MGLSYTGFQFSTPAAGSGSLAASVTAMISPLAALGQFTVYDQLRLHFPFDGINSGGAATACEITYNGTVIATSDQLVVATGECTDCSLSSSPPTAFPRYLQLTFLTTVSIPAGATVPTTTTIDTSSATTATNVSAIADVTRVTCSSVTLRASSSSATTTGLVTWLNPYSELLAYAANARVPAIDSAPFSAAALGAFDAPAYAGLANTVRCSLATYLTVAASADLVIALTLPSTFHIPLAVCTSPSVPTLVNPGQAFPNTRVLKTNGQITVLLWLPFAVEAGVTVSITCTSVGLPFAASDASTVPGMFL